MGTPKGGGMWSGSMTTPDGVTCCRSSTWESRESISLAFALVSNVIESRICFPLLLLSMLSEISKVPVESDGRQSSTSASLLPLGTEFLLLVVSATIGLVSLLGTLFSSS